MAAIRAANASDVAGIRALLLQNGLPVADLETSAIAFFVAEEGDGLAGVVGIEVFGEAALLRSLAVAPDRRQAGLGQALVAEAEAYAREIAGARELLLLTTTAAPFFAKRGYAAIDRQTAPGSVQSSAEFRALCPASATCMRKSFRKRVLFVCVENANRSQMAEAFARLHGGASVEAWSAGSHPSGIINPKAVRFMAELGYDLASHKSKSLDTIEGAFDAVVTMGCGDSCPWVPAERREDWALPDPKSMDDDAYRAVRDEIGTRVRALLDSL